MPPLRDIAGYLLIGISVLMLLKSLSLCAGNDIWYDELFTVGLAGHSYGELVMYTARDVHPPLYYCIVRMFTELCKLIAPARDAASAAKLVSLLPYAILLVYSVTLIRRRFGIFTGGLFLFCTLSMPQLSACTVEARMYSWALLFVTAAFLHAYEAVRAVSVEEAAAAEKTAGSGESGGRRAAASSRRHGAAFVLCGLAAAYTQYFACVAVVMIYLWLLCFFLRRDRRGIRRWLWWAGLSLLGYSPWLVSLFGQLAAVHENYWILPVSWRTFGGCVKFVMKPAFADETVNVVLAVVLFLASALLIGTSVQKLYHDGRVGDAGFVCAGVGVLAGLALFGIIASVVFRPIFVYRYMIPAMGCFWLAFAAAAGALAAGEVSAKGDAARGGGPGRKTDDASWQREGQGAEMAAQRDGAGPDTVGCRAGKIGAAALCALILCVGLRDYRAFMGEEEYKALQMEKTREALAAIGPEDILIFNFDQVQMVLGYYVNNESYLWYGQPEELIQEICGQKQSLDENTERIGEWLAAGRKVWFVGSFGSRDDIVSLWEAQGIRASEPTDCLLERYWFNLYELSAD